MHRLTPLLLILVAGCLSASSTFAAAPEKSPAATYSDHAVSFNYPTGWRVLPKSTTEAMAGPFAHVSGTTPSDVGGVSYGKSGTGVVVVIVKVNFTAKLEKDIKGHADAYLNGTIQGIKRSKGVRVLHVGTGKLGNLSAKTIDVMGTGNKNPSHQQYYSAISKNEKSAYLAIFVVVPPSKWSKYSSTLTGIAHSLRYH